jgi:hypothetical protein
MWRPSGDRSAPPASSAAAVSLLCPDPSRFVIESAETSPPTLLDKMLCRPSAGIVREYVFETQKTLFPPYGPPVFGALIGCIAAARAGIYLDEISGMV